MLEKLLSLDLPPGFVNNGTKYLAKGRWYTGSLVRFRDRILQPVGGWVQRATTGATIAGTPNAVISWQANDGSVWLAIGTTSNLYVVSSANVISDITPNIGFPAGVHTWQLDVFGSFLIAVDGLDAYTANYGGGAGYSNTFYWASDFSVTPIAIHAFDAFGASPGPQSVYSVVATPERFLVLLRGADPNGRSSRITTAGTPAIY